MAGNPLMGMLQGQNNPMSLFGGPIGNVMQLTQQLRNMRAQTNITPEQAKEKIMQMRNAGQINDTQIEQAKQLVEMLGLK